MTSSYLNKINQQAIEMCEKAGCAWNSLNCSFVETRDEKRETLDQYKSRKKDMISYEELRKNGLAIETTNRSLIEIGLKWLKSKLRSPLNDDFN